MLGRGGKRPARRLVCHAWGAPFLRTLLSVVLDASGWSREVLEEKLGKQSSSPNVDKLAEQLAKLGDEVMEKSYWLCVFAVNQHTALCGDCRGCRGGGSWAGPRFTEDPCAECRGPKRNPCPCGSQKPRPGEPGCELDKFGDLAARMERTVVSLDPELAALRRAWVIWEVGEAILHAGGAPVRFIDCTTSYTRLSYNIL